MGFVVRHTGTFMDLAIGTSCDAVDLVWCAAYSYTATALKGGERSETGHRASDEPRDAEHVILRPNLKNVNPS